MLMNHVYSLRHFSHSLDVSLDSKHQAKSFLADPQKEKTCNNYFGRVEVNVNCKLTSLYA